MKMNFEKRLRVARGVLFVAIAVWVVSWFFPELIFGKEAVISMYDGRAEVYAVDFWSYNFRMMSMMRGVPWSFKVPILGEMMLHFFNLGLLLSAPWLVGIYSRARSLRWLARLIALGYVVRTGYYAVRRMDEGAYPLLGGGWWMGYGAAVLFVVALFLIPRRPREVAEGGVGWGGGRPTLCE